MLQLRSRVWAAAAAFGSVAVMPVGSFTPLRLKAHADRYSKIPPTTLPCNTRIVSTSTVGVAKQDRVSIDIGILELQDFLRTAEKAARAAGSIIVANSGCCSKSTSSEGAEMKYSIKDVVTRYDREAQQAIYSIIRTAYPSHDFLGEEDVAAGSSASENALSDALVKSESTVLWICDRKLS